MDVRRDLNSLLEIGAGDFDIIQESCHSRLLGILFRNEHWSIYPPDLCLCECRRLYRRIPASSARGMLLQRRDTIEMMWEIGLEQRIIAL